ncbi:MAG: hypothetical protein J2P22_07815 [Nocardioides sp.]|nr:hypothetical protein [Nocardioides sp.]
MRQLVGLLGVLRQHKTPPELACVPRPDTAFYTRYRQIHDLHLANDPDHARHARCEDEEELQELAEQGLLFDVQARGTWAGLLAAEPNHPHGIQGVTVIELLLDHPYRGLGYGKHLSTLLAKALPMPDQTCLMGTIHADNPTAYRSALRAGRLDVRGEIRIPL